MTSIPHVNIPNIDLSFRTPFASQYNSDHPRINVGSKINPIYANGQKWTPAQKKRVIAITCLAIAALITLAAAIVTAATGSPLALICLVIGTVGCVFSATSLMNIKPALDDPRRLHAAREEIARLPVDAIITGTANKYMLEDISGYALLDRITGPKNPRLNNLTPDARDIFYDCFTQLAVSFENVQNQHHNHTTRIDQAYNDAVAPLNTWRNERNAEIERVRQAGNALQQSTRRTEPVRVHTGNVGRAIMRTPEPARGPYAAAGQEEARRGTHRTVAPAPYDVAGGDLRRNNGNGGSKTAEVVGELTNLAIQVGSELTAAQVRQTYEQRIADLENWKVRAIAQERGSYEAVLRALNLANNYQRILFAFQNSNYQTQSGDVPRTTPIASAPPLSELTPSPTYEPM